MERKILLAAIKDRQVFNRLEELGQYEFLSDSARIIYDTLRTYYEKDANVRSADLDIIKSSVLRSYPRQQKTFEAIFELLGETEEISPSNVADECLAQAERTLALHLSSALVSGDKNIPELLDRYRNLSESFGKQNSNVDDHSNEFTAIPVGELFSESESVRKIKLLPNALNERIGGGIEPGDNILIYARPEVGKSLFAINATCGFLAQGYRVLYYGNEDPTQRMVRRVVCRLSGMDQNEVRTNPTKAADLATRRGYDKFTFVKGGSNTLDEIRNKLEHIKPDILVIDQLRNIKTKNENRVLQLEEAAQGARQIANDYSIPVINVTQAGDSAEGKLVLTQGDVDYSNTGIPGAMDLMVGIGANDEYLRRQMRRVTLPKNKLNNDHSSFDVVVNEQLSKVE